MKQIYYLTTILFLTFISLKAQSDVVTGLNRPGGLVLNGNDLYIAEYSGGKIHKIDITATMPTTTDVVTELSFPAGLVLNGNDLYISRGFDFNFGGTLNDGKISKIDIAASSSTVTDVISGLDYPRGIVLYGNNLFIAQLGGDKISKIDITATSPIAVDFITINDPYKLLLNGNDLYVIESTANKISKIDITATTPTPVDVVTGLTDPQGLMLNGNDLYIAEKSAGKISKIDITASTPTVTDVITGLDGPIDMVINENILYVAEFEGGKISKFDISTLSINENVLKSKIQLYPNPSSDYIQFNNLNKIENYIIYNIVGSEINKGKINNGEKIDIKNFINGLYIIKFDNGDTFKLLKE